MTLVDSSDNDVPLVVSAAPARPSRRLVLVPESFDASRSRTVSGLSPVRSVVTPEVFPMSDDVDVEVAILACHAVVGGPRRVVRSVGVG